MAPTMDSARMKAILVFVAAVAFVTAPFWSGGFAGYEPDQFPVPQVEPPVQPAGYAFSIWGVIYLWLLLSAGFGLLARADDAEWDRFRWPLFVSLAVGASWLAVAQISPIWAAVLIWTMLATALVAMTRAPKREHWWARYAVEIYAGWLTAASCVSIGLLGSGYGVGPGQVAWALIALGCATAIATVVLAMGSAPFYAGALIWALIAVVVVNLESAPAVAGAAGLGILITGVSAVRGVRRSSVTS